MRDGETVPYVHHPKEETYSHPFNPEVEAEASTRVADGWVANHPAELVVSNEQVDNGESGTVSADSHQMISTLLSTSHMKTGVGVQVNTNTLKGVDPGIVNRVDFMSDRGLRLFYAAGNSKLSECEPGDPLAYFTAYQDEAARRTQNREPGLREFGSTTFETILMKNDGSRNAEIAAERDLI